MMIYVKIVLYVLSSNTSAISEARFMKKLNNTETELKKNVANKKSE